MYGIHVYTHTDVTRGNHELHTPLPRDISMTFMHANAHTYAHVYQLYTSCVFQQTLKWNVYVRLGIIIRVRLWLGPIRERRR